MILLFFIIWACLGFLLLNQWALTPFPEELRWRHALETLGVLLFAGPLGWLILLIIAVVIVVADTCEYRDMLDRFCLSN